MKAKFTLLVMLSFLMTTIYALENEYNRGKKMFGSFLKHRFERYEKGTENLPFLRKMEFRKQAVQLKSAQAIKQRLDSYTGQEWDEINKQWIPVEKAELIYDANWNVTIENYYTWDIVVNQWNIYYKLEYVYDAQGNIIQENDYHMNENNQLVAADKTIFSFDANGNMTQEMNSRWESFTNTFVAEWIYDYTYDTSGNLILEIYSRLDEITNQLTANFKDEYKYNNEGRKLQHFNSYWDKTSGQWILTNKWDYIYDSKGNNVLVQNAYLNGIDQWYDSSKDEFTYDDKGQLIQELNSNLRNGLWIMNYKDNYTYDDFGNIIQQIGYRNWDVSSGQWDDVWKNETTFDNNYTANDLILPFYEQEVGFFTHMITEMQEYEWNTLTNDWLLGEKTVLAYSAHNVTSIKLLGTEISKVFPNPCSETVTFSIPDSYSQSAFQLFDLQGRQLISKEIRNNEKISMESFRNGMYIYKLHLDGKVLSGKLVKQ